MRWIALVSVVVAVLALAVTLVGWRLPRAHVASRRSRVAAPPDVVWRLLTDVAAFPSWRSGVKAVTLMAPDDGRMRWVEEGPNGRVAFALDRAEPQRRLVTRIADPSLPFGGSWTFDLLPAPDGVEVTITENGEIYNPVFRFMARFVFGYEATMKQYLDDLQRAVAAGRT